MEDRILKIKEQVKELLEWKRNNSIQQVKLPVGFNTQAIIQQNHFVVKPDFIIVTGTELALEVMNDSTLYYLPALLNA